MTAAERLIDTNVLVHAYVFLDTKKHASARETLLPIWNEGGGFTTVQNLCEFFVVVTKKIERPMPVDQAGSIVREILSSVKWRVLDRREGTVVQAIDFVKLHRLSLWDALIAACMLEHGVHTVVTENERDFRKVPGIGVINPFKPGVKR